MTADKPLTLVPKLRFPEFHNDGNWGSTKLGQVCRITTGKKDVNEGCSEGPYPFFTCAETHTFSKSYSFDAEAILVAGNANVGLAKYYNGKFEAYQRTYVLTDFANIDVSYLYSILGNTLRPALLAQVQTSAMSYIRLPMLQTYELAVPKSFPEQQKIADCLGSLDDLIAAEGRKLDALRQHKQGLMQQLFPQPGQTVPRLRFPEFRNAAQWKPKKLGQIGELVGGGTPGTSVPEYWGGNIQWYTPTEVKDRNLSKSKRTITREGLNNSSAKLLPIGSLLITTRASIGDIGIAGSPCATNQGFQSLVVAESEANTFWYYWLVQHGSELTKRASGSTFLEIGKTELKKVPVLRPDEDEQRRIADCLGSLDDLIAAKVRNLESLRQHKKGLMQQIFPSFEEESR